jgi:hypothetical protein
VFGLGLLCLFVGSALGGYSVRRTIARRLGTGPLVRQGIVAARAPGSDIPHPRLPEVIARTLNILLVVAGVVLLWSTIGAGAIALAALIFGVDAALWLTSVWQVRRAQAATRPGPNSDGQSDSHSGAHPDVPRTDAP